MSKMTGGTAKIVNRKPTPASQRRPTAIQEFRMVLPAAAFAVLIVCSLPRLERMVKWRL
jgi:hypothetical protein